MTTQDSSGLKAYYISKKIAEKYRMGTLDECSDEFVAALNDPAKALKMQQSSTQISIITNFFLKLERRDFDNMDKAEKRWKKLFDKAYSIYSKYLDRGESVTIAMNALLGLEIDQMYQPIAEVRILDRHRDAARSVRKSQTVNMTAEDWKQNENFDSVWNLLDNIEYAQKLIIHAKTNGKGRFAELYELHLRYRNLEDVRLDMELSKRHFNRILKDAISYAEEYHKEVS